MNNAHPKLQLSDNAPNSSNTIFILSRQSIALLRPMWWIHHSTGVWFLKISNLYTNITMMTLSCNLTFTLAIFMQETVLLDELQWYYLFMAFWTVVIFVPEAVHWRTKKANSKHHWHQASNKCCQTGFWSVFQIKQNKSIRKPTQSSLKVQKLVKF